MASAVLAAKGLEAAFEEAGVRPKRILLLGALAGRLEGRDVVTATEAVADRSVDAAVLVDAFAHGGPDLAEVQRVLKPGALIVAFGRQPSRAARELGHYFDPAPPLARRPTGIPVTAQARRLSHLSGHFDEIAPDYATQIPPHVRDHYLARKLAAFERFLPTDWKRGVGLDLGCGLGWYANAVAERYGARVVALDASAGPLGIGRSERTTHPGPAWVAGDSLRLPFRDASLDYAYAINMVHHLKRGEQERALAELQRVLKPGAPFLLFEINTRNPLFAWYMRHVFPRTRSIDRGDEEFVHPSTLPLVPGFRLESVDYSTFAPDFVPRWALRAARSAEALLERSPLRRYAIHYVALLRTVPTGGAAGRQVGTKR